MKTFQLTIIIILITLSGAFFRFYQFTKNPPSLTGDEISFGYSAYSILKTGKDEYGKFLPITFKSVGDYKNPLPAYLMIAPIKLFGLTDFAVRFNNALFGTLMIPLFFVFLTILKLKPNYALIGTLIFTLSSWQIFYSRFAYEPLLASFFILVAVISFIRSQTGKLRWGILSVIFFALTMYTAFAPRLFVPLFVVALLIIDYFKNKKISRILIFAGVLLFLLIPLTYSSIFEGAGTRFSMVFLANDIDYKRYITFDASNSIFNIYSLVLFWLTRYLNYLNPDFIFLSGMGLTNPGNIGLGPLYLIELPVLVIGLIQFIKNSIPHKIVFAAWILIGFIPDSLTNNAQHAGRLLHIAPVVYLLLTLGVIRIISFINRINLQLRTFGLLIIFILVLTNFAHAFLTITTHFPSQKGEYIDEGLREAVYYVLKNQDKYQQIVFDPRHGTDGPNLISNPYLYLIFYTQYDPTKYQQISKQTKSGGEYYYSFDKYEFRNINWPIDSKKTNTLYIGSPWSFPLQSLKEGELLHKIIISSGLPAYYIVSPK